jgi:uncharacterized DUF497 family protein
LFDAPDKLTLESPTGSETRLMDVALVALVYVLREPGQLRAISLRRASKQERTLYAQNYH